MTVALVALALTGLALLVALVSARKNAFRVGLLEQALRDARTEHEQQERLLQTVVENAPMAIVVYGQTGKLLYSNAEARELFFEGQSLTGENFLRLLDRAPEALRQALVVESDALFTVDEDGEAGTYHLAKRYFELEHQPYTLLMVKHLTP
ncbi:MAG TPA: hypothetical protein VHM25_00125, partial [Polyangiaceae bacterium]|nr:hypothetical protein [Polyangiaceae bacterium]